MWTTKIQLKQATNKRYIKLNYIKKLIANNYIAIKLQLI